MSAPDADGTTLETTAAHTRSLESIFGTVEVTRTGYRAGGTPSLHRLDVNRNSRSPMGGKEPITSGKGWNTACHEP